ncbi:CYTH and CHAD domain-containing protein [Actinomadura barringtoniae]|uniref:CYTH and CHAD domain-containing protein n=2 Tax=Actinomadura barringtoniae TaxID=1427535 RepID=A0A939PFC6_9ACTN|nr:CYTH and CHAD domain-containing protein [Actinomadura barringtoniae]
MAMNHLEIERKYDADADFAVPEMDGLPGVAETEPPKVHRLSATYFDTEDQRLASYGITLRRRRGGEDAGWHLKIPAGPDSRNELRAPLGRAQVVPAKLAGLVAAYVRGASLRPIAVLETVRTEIRLLDDRGVPLAELADDLVTGRVMGQDGESSWREVEVELGEAGGLDFLKAAEKRLKKAGARPASSGSKLGRLLGREPDEVRKGGDTAGDAVVGYLAEQVAALLRYDPRARLAEFDAVHRMRVATRRIRSALQSYRAIVDRKHTDEVRAELKWLAEELGAVRDLEVLRMHFTARLEEVGEPAEQDWLKSIGRHEEAAYRRLNVVLKEPRYFALLDALDALVAEPPLTERAEKGATVELPKLVKRSWKRLVKAHRAVANAEHVEEARHEMRKSAKKARYAAELAVPVLGQAAKDVAKNAKRVQEVLGDYQDGVIAMDHLRDAATRVTERSEAFTIGVLYGVERCEALRSISKLEATWEETSPPSF